jgi:hypothetical protein
MALTKHQRRCVEGDGWSIVTEEPLKLIDGAGDIATGRAAEAVIKSATEGQIDYEEMICYDGRICNCGSEKQSGATYDAQNIYLTRCCEDCAHEKLSKYRPEILKGYTQADVDEPIESEDG